MTNSLAVINKLAPQIATKRELRIEAIEDEIVDHKKAITRSFVEVGKLLLEVYEESLFAEKGYDSFGQWLSSPEVDFSRSVGYDLIRIAKLIEVGFLPAQGIADIGVSKIRLLLPKIAEAPDDLQEWLYKAEILTWRDLKDEVAGRDGFSYFGRGMLSDLIAEMQERDELWDTEVTAKVSTI